MKTFGFIVWLYCSAGPADYAIPMSPASCEAAGPAIAREVRLLGPADAVWRCDFFEAPPDDVCER